MSIPKEDERTPDPIGMVRECADWDAQAAYIDVLEKVHGYENVSSPAYHATSDEDDKIPF